MISRARSFTGRTLPAAVIGPSRSGERVRFGSYMDQNSSRIRKRDEFCSPWRAIFIIGPAHSPHRSPRARGARARDRPRAPCPDSRLPIRSRCGEHQDPDGAMSRRTLLRGAAGGAALIAGAGLPAWAKPPRTTHHLRRPDSLPFPNLPAGTPSMHEIEHIVVLMMENHSFDNLLGKVPHEVPGRQAVDGFTMRGGHVTNSNPDASGRQRVGEPRPHAVPAPQRSRARPGTPATSPLTMAGTTGSSGRAATLRCASGTARTFRTRTRWHATTRWANGISARSSRQTYPNRRFFFTGHRVRNDRHRQFVPLSIPAKNGTIWDRLDAH